MKKENIETKKVPPYVAYKTLENFLDRLKVGIPARIDRSVMPSSFSGGVQWQLTSALSFLNLIGADGNTTDMLRELVESNDEKKKEVWKKIISDSYQFIFQSGIDLKKMTMSQLHEAFENEGTSGDTTKKSIRFFMTVAKVAGIQLSPHTKPPRVYATRKTKKNVQVKQNGTGVLDINEDRTSALQDKETYKMWLDKFPSFDPSWSPEMQIKWLETYRELKPDFKK